jgi:hypothetical protein
MIHKFGQQCQRIFLFFLGNFFFSSQFMNFTLLAELVNSSFAFIVPVSLPQGTDAMHKRIRLPTAYLFCWTTNYLKESAYFNLTPSTRQTMYV